MKVYAAIAWSDDCGSYCHFYGVFTTMEKAQSFIANNPKYGGWIIEPVELDNEDLPKAST